MDYDGQVDHRWVAQTVPASAGAVFFVFMLDLRKSLGQKDLRRGGPQRNSFILNGLQKIPPHPIRWGEGDGIPPTESQALISYFYLFIYYLYLIIYYSSSLFQYGALSDITHNVELNERHAPYSLKNLLMFSNCHSAFATRPEYTLNDNSFS